MQFDSLAYVLLLAATVPAFFAAGPRVRLWVLIAASLLFYSVWSVPLTGLIVLSAVVDYVASRGIAASRSRAGRRAWLGASLAVNLGVLGYFKYANFFLDNLRVVFGDGIGHGLALVLPPGISFYTFQTMSYTIDVYRGAVTPTRSFSRLFLFVSFFPQLVAGPIERAGHLMTQFEQIVSARFRSENLAVGMRMIVWGLAKKVLLADTCARLVEPVYADVLAHDGWTLLVATYAFTLQIYFDFSAYSEIARGSARLFGVDLMRNFDQPYLVTNVSAFWRRWHISLSTWIRDYVYVPLGGNRGSRPRVLFNLVVTMFLSGLWHGAAWTFVLWGLYHGLLLLVDALVRRTRAWERVCRQLGASLVGALGWLVTFHAVVLGWVLFRAQSLADVGGVVQGIAAALGSGSLPAAGQAVFLVVLALVLVLSRWQRRADLLGRIDRDLALSVLFYGTLVGVMILAAPDESPAFIYFQF